MLVLLPKGLEIAGKLQQEAELREVTAADIFAAQDEAERLIFVPSADGKAMQPQLVVSDAKMGRAILRRQIVRIGELQAKDIDEATFGRLCAADLAALEEASAQLEAGAANSLRRATERGRDDGAGASPGDAGPSD